MSEDQTNISKSENSNIVTGDEGEAKQLSHPHLVVPAHLYAGMREHRGPLPTTEYLREINEIIPNGAERILAMAEKHAEHRQRMEQKELDAIVEHDAAEMTRSNKGLVAGFAVAMSLVGASAYLITAGHDISGTIVGSFDIVGLVSVFVIGRVYSQHNSHEKLQSEQSSETSQNTE